MIFPVCYGFCLLAVFMVFVVVGVMLCSTAFSGPVVIRSYCEGEPISS